ncbi:TIGR02680 family protein [Candidatus Poriferisocius sp.]|uniref:TIGR02680 family protein n=1 Tax=Candidatus Poriferisocius sp. TaxID=3101276 RepID=UPI003B5BDAE0
MSQPGPLADKQALTNATTARGRWILNRAGIVNVYQYENEVLHFGGGRLLLRGVNGSGKTTAMNMLLPFLLTARLHRIDAAGEQSGMLKTWMLDGREDAQPVGYLWIEFERQGEFLVCGCGIKANRSSDTVTTWWFITPKRPGVDLHLIERRIPLSADALKAALGGDQVFHERQRSGYRKEIEGRLFDGASIDQHIGLINVVRSPRVGDRIDVDLPAHLTNALPHLSDQALSEAAQPLDDLEEHRGNVAELARTLDALRGLLTVYRAYCVGELRQRETAGRGQLDDQRASSEQETRARREAAAAEAEVGRLDTAIAELEKDAQRLAGRIDALERSQVYRDGQDLDALRQLVGDLDTQRNKAVDRVADRTRRVERAVGELIQARQRCRDDVERLNGGLATATELGGRCRVDRRPPNPVVLAESTLGKPVQAESTVPRTEPTEPADQFDCEEINRQIAAADGAVLRRRADIEAVESALGSLESAEQQLSLAESARDTAARDSESAAQRLKEQRDHLDALCQKWSTQTRFWASTVQPLLAEVGIRAPATAEWAVSAADSPATTITGTQTQPDGASPHDADSVVDRLKAEHGELRDEADLLVDFRRDAVAAIGQRLLGEREAREEAQALVDELAARTEPDPPRFDWQTPSHWCLADLIDFAPHLEDDGQAALEAALHASGLLSARLGDGPAVELDNGELVAVVTGGVSNPLSEHLTVTVPNHLIGTVDEGLVARLLDSISCDLSSDASTVVAFDGAFRVGSLRGRHTKRQAEFIGVTARRAALDRARQDAAERLAQAQAVFTSSEAERDMCRSSLDQAKQHRSSLPAIDDITVASARVDDASQGADEAERNLAAAIRQAAEAERRQLDESNALHQKATTLALPADRTGLSTTHGELSEMQAELRQCRSHLNALERSFESWRHSVGHWQTEIGDLDKEQAEQRSIEAKHRREQARLATIEENIGAEYAEVLAARDSCRRELDDVKTRLPATRDERDLAFERRADTRAKAVAAASRRAASEQRCEEMRQSLAAALAIPGLRATVARPEHPDSGPVSTVATGAAGLGELVEAVQHLLDASQSGNGADSSPPSPPDGERDVGNDRLAGATTTTADGVRQSLLRRRDTLGAGWDAEARQPDPAQPLVIEVTGPLGKKAPLVEAMQTVEQQHQQLAGLLSRKQDDALRELLQGLVAREVAEKVRGAKRLVDLMNQRLETVTTAHQVGVGLRWRRSPELDPTTARMVDLLATLPDLRTDEDEQELRLALSNRLDEARNLQPDTPYRQLIADTLDYKQWHDLAVMLRRPGSNDVRLSRRTPLSEGEKKLVTYLPLFAAVAASYDALAEQHRTPDNGPPGIARFILLDDAFAKVSEDNHDQLFGLLVDLDLDLIATSERLWGTLPSVPELAITEVCRDATLNTILLEHYRWDGITRERRDSPDGGTIARAAVNLDQGHRSLQ